MTDDPPTVPEGVLDGWTRTDTQYDRLLDLPGLSVTAATAVYEDADLRRRLRERTSMDLSWRFFFASRLQIRPTIGASRALRGVVASRAREGFVDRLRDRGFEDVRTAESRSLRVGDETADAVRYEGTLRMADVVVVVEGWLAVWPVGSEFRIAGGAYPTAVRADDDARTGALADAFAPTAFREELIALVRAVE